jgi:hypothetical protein
MAYRDNYESTSGVATKDIGQAIDDMKMTAQNRRRIFERRWYDNNFFDDGFHFRYLSRSSNKIVDLSERATIYTPQRSIPKSSRQIRGVANLLMSSDPTPAVYPSAVNKQLFRDEQTYKQAVEVSKEIAKKRGLWLLDEWQNPDESDETVLDKLAFMLLLTFKHGVSYLKIWPDEHEEKINTSVRDAFDIYTLGNLTSIYHSPFLIDSVPQLVAQIKANPIFDEEQLEHLNPDNKKASSEIKEAYLQSRYGRDTSSDQSATLILNEAFIKEYVNKDNKARIMAQKDNDEIVKKLEGKTGSIDNKPIIRHVFSAGGVWLYDKYTSMTKYPYVDYRMEAGPIYQVPLIERFMPANKSLDSIVSRVERYTHTMVTGAWLKRRGENFKINNIAGGQVIEYDAVPPTQAQVAPLPPFVYEFISLLTNFIEEQGVSTTTLGKIPSGVKAHSAIESLKESEYANLVIASRRFRSLCKRLARQYFEIADEYYVTPHPITKREKNDVISFSVIGNSALQQRRVLKVETPDGVVPIDKNTPLDIEIEQGMAYTKEGQKDSMKEVMASMIQGVQVGAIPPQALQTVFQKYLEVYQYGATEEFMEDLDKALKGGQPMGEQQILQMKTAVLEAMKEAGEVGPEASQKRVMENKYGTLAALKESGLAQKIGQMAAPPTKESVSINYNDAPPDIQRQMEAQAGFQPSKQTLTTDQAIQHAKLMVEMEKAKSSVQVAKVNK